MSRSAAVSRFLVLRTLITAAVAATLVASAPTSAQLAVHATASSGLRYQTSTTESPAPSIETTSVESPALAPLAPDASDDASSSGPTASAYDPELGLVGDASIEAAPLDEGALFELTDALALDVMTNPAYSEATKALLLGQIADDFSQYDEVGRRVAKRVRATGGLRRLSGGRFQAGIASDDSLAPLAPQALRLRAVGLLDPYTRDLEIEICDGIGTPCPLPLEWNVSVPLVELVWSFADEAARVAYRDAANGVADTALRVLKNGVLQNRGERESTGWGVSGDYYAFYEGEDCGPSIPAPCLRVIFARPAWFDTAPPWSDWSIAVEAWSVEPLDQLVIDFDRFGNPIVVTEGWQQQQGATATVAAPETVKDFFTATIGASVLSARCTTCHAMDTPHKISVQHGGLVSPSDVYLDDSIVSAGAQINTCESCHVVGATHLYTFDEERWATPTPAQDIDWGAIIATAGADWAREVCERIVGHLTTPQARAHHFHQDARLHWAVADGKTPFGEQKTRAQPQDYYLFLKHFDAWNDAGARCPL